MALTFKLGAMALASDAAKALESVIPDSFDDELDFDDSLNYNDDDLIGEDEIIEGWDSTTEPEAQAQDKPKDKPTSEPLKEAIIAPAEAPIAAQQPAKKLSLTEMFYQQEQERLAAHNKAIQPKAKQSLAEKLEEKRKLKEEAALSEDGAAELNTKDFNQEEEQGNIVKDVPDAPKVLPAAIIAAKIKPTVQTVVIEPKNIVIEVLGKNYTLEELALEIASLQLKTAKIKFPALAKKLEAFQTAEQELLNLLDLKDDLEADAAGPVGQLSAGTAAIKEIFNGEAPIDGHYHGAFSLDITLNEKQIMAKELAMAGKSFCLIGAAGTGKTTAQRSVAEALLESDALRDCSYKVQGGGGTRVDAPSFAAVAYTRRASANLARAIHKNPRLEQVLKHNIMTIHSLLEYEPVIFYDAEKERESMRFEPQKTAADPLTITHLVIEEASMVGLDLWEKLYDALPRGVQIIFIGDLNQLPPVFGPSILNYALRQLPIIELTHVYRQKGDSLVLTNAHNILEGKSLEEGAGFEIVRGKNQEQVGQEKMAMALSKMYEIWYDSGAYQPDEDMILSPFNKQALGTDNMNKWIAQFLGAKRKAIVHEIIAGFATHYLAVGDRVMVNKQDGYVTKISNNASYHGTEPQLPGSDLSRFGVRIMGEGAVQDSLDDVLLGYTDFSLEDLEKELAERKQQASHLVDILLESGQQITCSAAGDFGPQVFSLGYVLTVHKAQGCEFRKVFIMLHKDHSVMLFRELLYTAETRAREHVVLVAKDWVIDKAIRTQRIKGNSLEDKLEFFNSGAVDMLGHINCVKN